MDSVEEKYVELDELRYDGEITDEEYRKRRASLLAEEGTRPHRFDTEEDIISMILFLQSEAQDAHVYPVEYVADPKRMIQLGLWPTSVHTLGEPWVFDWLKGESQKTIAFWSDVHTKKVIRRLHDELVWSYKTLQTHKREAVESASSLSLMLYAPELIYKGSLRPVTDMSLFRSTLSRTIRRDGVKVGIAGQRTVNILGEDWKVVPVARYAAGMSRGLYWDAPAGGSGSAEEDKPGGVCGTFTSLSLRAAHTIWRKSPVLT